MKTSVVEASSVPGLLRARANDPGVAHRIKHLGLWQAVSWSEYSRQVDALACEMIALGLEPGERVAVLCENRPEWLVADLAIQTAGAATVGVYTTSSAEQLAFYLEHSDAVGLILEDAEQLEKWLAVRQRSSTVRWVIVVEPDEQVTGALNWAEVLANGAERHRLEPGAVDSRLASIEPDAPALFIYTSGTTGEPKGARLSHNNLLWAIDALQQTIPHYREDELLSFLPLSHIVERLISVVMPLKHGYTVSFTENLDTVLTNLQEIRPTIFFAVPRIWEKLYSMVELRAKDAQTVKRAVYRWAMGAALRAVGQRHGPAGAGMAAGSTGQPATAATFAPLRALANLLVIRILRYRLGLDRVRVAISGAAPISPEILAYVRALGVDIREGFGLTESAGLIAINPEKVRLGTVGTGFAGVEIRIAEDGEILSRSPGNFLGYHKDPAATAAALEGGWLHTGDIGELDPDGYLRITDRKKDILITAGGKNIAPQKIENQLKSSVYVNDAVVIGDRRPYLVALLVLDEDNVNHWAAERQVAYTTYTDLTQNPEVIRLISGEVDLVNAGLARTETIKRFAILPKRLHHEDGEVTATLKVKRASLAARYQPLIEQLYARPEGAA